MFTQQQEDLRKSDPIRIARSFVSSTFVYDGDSKVRKPNPEFHPPICQKEDGTYCDVEGRPLAKSDIPAYILAAGKPPKATPLAGRREMTIADVVQEATSSNAVADAPVRRGRAKTK